MSNEQIKSPATKIEVDGKLVAQAQKAFNKFLEGRTKQKSKENAGFSIGSDFLSMALGLPALPPLVLEATLDAVVLSTPGMGKTPGGYGVVNPDLFYERFGPGMVEKKILNVLSNNPDKIFSHKDLSSESGCTVNTVIKIVNKLEAEGKVSFIQKGTGGSATLLKFVTQI